MPKKTYDDVIGARENLIRIATLDTRKWCVAPASWVGKRRSDQYWMERFSPEQVAELNAKMAHRFLVSFQLTNRVQWDTAQVAGTIRTFVSEEPCDPVSAIVALATGLRRCNGRQTRQTSAASKIAMFAKPAAQVFIWDALAACSARARDWYRNGRQTARYSTAVFCAANGEHDYPAHHAACARALADEQKQNDFKAAVANVEDFLLKVGGPMKDRTLVPANFVERRVLDKLMFWEGSFMKKGALPPISDFASI